MGLLRDLWGVLWLLWSCLVRELLQSFLLLESVELQKIEMVLNGDVLTLSQEE